jgi:hypothetical protein
MLLVRNDGMAQAWLHVPAVPRSPCAAALPCRCSPLLASLACLTSGSTCSSWTTKSTCQPAHLCLPTCLPSHASSPPHALTPSPPTPRPGGPARIKGPGTTNERGHYMVDERLLGYNNINRWVAEEVLVALVALLVVMPLPLVMSPAACCNCTCAVFILQHAS